MRNLTLVLVCSSIFANSVPANEFEFFEKKIRPVLVEHCYKCHSTEKKRGGLLLDSREATLKGGDSGPALVPGKPNESLLLSAVLYEQEDLKMPPRGKLSETAVADLRKWIEMGAPDPRTGGVTTERTIDLEEGRKFWAFQPLQSGTIPEVARGDWAHNEIDRYVLSKLEQNDLAPVADAEKNALLRRATFALTGLPPTLEEIAAFQRDTNPNAFATVVDRLLDSPRFGERWGRHWLDVARFAESTGGGRSLLLLDAWRYRDYVIDSFNRDKPYDQFVREQLAGDLLPFKTPEEKAEQLVATAFLALGPTNYELQDKEVLEMDVIDEQLDTMGRTFLGLTIGCARCHDHKFDPIPTADYYALAGIFHSTQTLVHNNVSKWVETPLPMSPEAAEQLKEYNSQVKTLTAKIETVKAMLKGKASAKSGQVAVKDLPGIVIDDSQATKVGEWTNSTHHPSFVGVGYTHDDNLDKGNKTITFVPKIKQDGDYEVRFAYTPGTNRDAKVPITIFSADGEKLVYVDERKQPPIDGHFISLGTYRFESNDQWYVMVSNEGTTDHVIADAVQFLSEDDLSSTAKPKKESVDPNAALARKELAELESKLKKLRSKAPQRPVAMSVKDAGKPHDIAICIRGNYHSQGEKVKRGFLQILPTTKSIADNASGRLELAQWLTSSDNPLTARVMVNRIWHHLFGVGLVRTVDNFGKMGEQPSHRELLDWLAQRFVDEGWSVKKLIREIMLSRTYQLGIAKDTQALAVDPENRLLWRMNRRRLDAESLRDAMLSVSGQLDLTVGGLTVRKGTSIEYGYKFDDTRRSVYTPVFRNRLLELFEVFDFADPNLVMGRRSVSTVPPQGLFLMNSPFVMEQAEAAAHRLLDEGGGDDALIDRAYLRTLGRRPTDREREIAERFLGASTVDATARQKRWERFYQVLFACIDFRYVQ